MKIILRHLDKNMQLFIIAMIIIAIIVIVWEPSHLSLPKVQILPI